MKNFLAQFKGWVHWFAGVVVAGAMIYSTNDAVHNAVNAAVAPHKRLAAFVTAVGGILVAYAKSTKTS